MSAVLLGIGTATPDAELWQADAASIAAGLMGVTDRRRRAVAALYEQSGVDVRRTAIGEGTDAGFFEVPARAGVDGPGTGARVSRYREVAPALAEAACLDGLRASATDPGRVTHLVTVSCTGFHAPGVDVELIRRLGLPATVQRTHVGFMGCHGAINGLRVAAALAESDPDAVVLLCCVEICSVHFQYRPHNGAATANALFGDGAAACVVAGRGDGPRLARFGAVLIEDSLGEMGWKIGDHGFEMSLSARVPALLRERVGAWVDGWLAGAGLSRGDVGSWAVHPGGPRIVEGVRESLGLEPGAVAASLEVLRTHGNMSSPTVLFIARRMLEAGAAMPMVGLAFGPGLGGEAFLLRA